ncbi:MAG: hypothetical protein NTV23_16205 [Propionibacteriales bacterium]|nr:hypothetical protein [Propionibacteriales bacterium]
MTSHLRRFLAASAVPVLLGTLAACGSTSRPAAADPGPDSAKTFFGPEGMAVQEGKLLAVPSTTRMPIGEFTCSRPDLTFHAHAHLSVYVDGRLRAVPSTIGTYEPVIEDTRTGPLVTEAECFYNLHTHAQDGVIHFEAPQPREFTLGQFFAVWGQPLSGSQVGRFRGPVTVYVDGRRDLGDPAEIVLTEKRTIQLVVGKDVQPVPVDWSHF